MMTSKTTVRKAKQAFWLVSGKMKQDAYHNTDTSTQLKYITVTCTLSLVTSGIKIDPKACGTNIQHRALCRGSSVNPIKPKLQSWLGLKGFYRTYKTFQIWEYRCLIS